jgi:uncharacterized protein (TIRG00374 family)
VRKKQLLVNGAKYGVALGLLAWVISRNWAPQASGGPGLSEIFSRPKHVEPLLIAGMIYLGALLLTFFRWYILVRAQDLPFTWLNAVRLGFIGVFFNAVLPGAIGGDLVKVVCIAREQSRRTVAAATVLVDRAMGLWGLVWLMTLLGGAFWLIGDPAITMERPLQLIVLSAAAIVVISAATWFTLGFLPTWRAHKFATRLERLPKVGHSAAEFWRAIWMYRCQKRAIAAAVGLAIANHLCVVLTFYFAAQVIRDPGQPLEIPTFTQHFLLVPIGTAIQTIPLFPGGIGVGEEAFARLYGLVHQPPANGVVVMFVYRVINWAWGLFGFVLYMRMPPALRPTPEEEGELTPACVS